MKSYLISKKMHFFIRHLAISLLIAFLIIGLVFFIWYPSPLAKAAGVTHIFLMLMIIDVIVGPLLGLVIYKQEKKSLKFDLFVIIFIQISALSYGVYSIAQGRPVAVIYSVDRFELIQANDIVSATEKKSLPWLGPQFAAVKYSTDPKQKNNETFAEVFGGVSLAQRPERYISLTEVKSDIQQATQDVNLLKNFNASASVAAVLNKYPGATTWLPLKSNTLDMVVLLDKSRDVIGIVDLRPWH